MFMKNTERFNFTKKHAIITLIVIALDIYLIPQISNFPFLILYYVFLIFIIILNAFFIMFVGLSFYRPLRTRNTHKVLNTLVNEMPYAIPLDMQHTPIL